MTQPPPIACTLSTTDRSDREGWIARLNDRALLSRHRDGRRVLLTYKLDAAAEVQSVIAAERSCCSFLTFTVTTDDETVKVCITAPEEAAGALDEVFAPFLVGSQCGCDEREEGCKTTPSSHRGIVYGAGGLSALSLSCGLCCLLPLLVPAASLGALGALVSTFAALSWIITPIAAVIVVAAWTSIYARQGPSLRTDIYIASAATLGVVLAILWPHVEPLLVASFQSA